MSNEQKIDESLKTPSFSMSKYIIYAILPKCNLIYGEVIPSTFIQIALTINNKPESPEWQKNKSWIGIRTISKITGFNVRTINRAISVLIDIGLIHQSYRGKLKMFQLKNYNINNQNDLIDFIKSVEKTLLTEIKIDKKEEFRKKFNELNEKLNLDSQFHCQQLLKKIWIPDLLTLKEALKKAESIYKGSSLFLINLINQQLMFKKEIEETDYIISERERGLMIGCSQSTLNRYIKAYESADMIVRESLNGSYHIKLNSKEKIKAEIIQNKGVGNLKMNKDQLICPICDRICETSRSFNLHLSKQSDAKHLLLNKIRRDKRTSDFEITMMLYEQNKDTFESLEIENVIEEQIVKTSYMDVPCECKISCQECFMDWKKDYFDGCSRPRKQAYIEENNAGSSKAKKQKTNSESATGFEMIPSVKKVPSEDTAPGLLKFFYDLTGKRSPNWGKESKQIKNLLTSKEQPLSAEEVRVVLRYMTRRGYDDVRFLSSSVTEALLENEYLQQIETPGTAPFLLKYFYNGHNMEINLQTFTREVRKIQETMNSGLNYEDTKKVIDYMIDTNCITINFIGSKRNDALSKKPQNVVVNTNSKTTNNFNNNPSFFDQDFLNILKDELIGGRCNLRKVEEKHKDGAIKLAKQIFMEQKFTTKFTGFEWLWRTGLELDKEIYEQAYNEVNRTSYLDSTINSGKINEDQLNKYKQLKNKFELWLQKQHNIFHHDMISNNS
ncbi:hypothetical protein D3C87_78680 [compost metagenome]